MTNLSQITSVSMVKQVHNPVRTYGPETVQEITADEIVDWQLVKNLIIVLSGGTLLSVGFKFDIDLIFFLSLLGGVPRHHF